MKYRSFLRIAALAFAGLMSSSVFAAVLMPSGGDDSAAIQNALNSAGTGTVELGEGTFKISATGGVTLSNGVTLKGQGWDKTIVQGGTCQRGFKLTGGSKLEGMTIQGFTGSYRGSAIYAEKGSVSWCCVKDNVSTATDTGNAAAAGICILNGTIDHCIVANNSVASSSIAFGAGIGGLQSGSDGSKIGPVTIDTCLVYGNDNGGSKSGGGIAFSNWSGAVTIRNCTIAGNSAKNGSGGVYHDATAGKVTLINNIIVDNSVGESELNVSVKANFLDMTDSASTIITGSATGTGPYVDASIVSELSAKGFASADPKFADAANGDYHIDSSSPATKAGKAGVLASGAIDLDQNEFSEPPSIGCYESTGVSSPKFSPEDGRTFVSTLDVTLTCSTEGATIKYTTNGGDPASGTVYNGTPIRLTATTTIKAQTFAEGTDPSPVVTATYTKETARGPAVSGGAVGVTPRATGAVIEGTVSDIGNNGATKCDVYLVYATSSSGFGEPVKIASGLVSGGMFTYTVSGLTPSTSYSYKLTVTNDAETPMSATVSGSFTTKDAGAVVEPGGSPEDTWQILQEAINSSPNETVRLAEATFEIKKELTINNGCSLLGNPSRPDRVVIALVTQTVEDGDHSMLVISGSPDTIVSGVTFTANGAKNGNTQYGPKSGVQMDSGTLEDCVISDVKTRNGSYNGGGINMTGGTVRRCTVTRCEAYNTGGFVNGSGEAIYMTAGLVENCTIRENRVTGEGGVGYVKGGAVYISGGILRGCLIARNVNHTGASGVAVDGVVTVENCTVADNGNYKSASDAVGLRVSSKGKNSVIRNNIIWGNYASDGTTLANLVFDFEPDGNVVFDCNDTSPAVSYGNGNISADPKFSNAAGGDYHIGFTTCVDHGSNQEWMTGAKDIEGNDRIRNNVVDMGCYEREPQTGFLCSIMVSSDGAAGNAKVKLEFLCSGGTVTEALWLLVREQDGAQRSSSDFSPTLILPTGDWTITLQVKDQAQQVATSTESVKVKALIAYVNVKGHQVFPYDSVENGAPAIEYVLPLLADGGTVMIAPGSYVLSSPIKLSGSGMTRLVSVNGPKNTIVRLDDNSLFRDSFGLTLSCADAYVAGLTFVAGRPGEDYSGSMYETRGFVHIQSTGAGSMVTNCVFRDLRRKEREYGTGAYFEGSGTVVDCQFSRIDCFQSGAAPTQGGVIRVCAGGLLDRCVIADCWAEGSARVTDYNYGYNLGDVVGIWGGTVRNSLITRCRGSNGSPVFVGVAFGSQPGRLENCTVVGNSNDQTEDACGETLLPYQHSGGISGGIENKGYGVVENCIVANNYSFNLGRVCNIDDFYNNLSITYTLADDRDASFATEENHNIAYSGELNKVLLNPGGGDYRLASGSPAIDKAKEEDWMLNTLDLAGNARSVGRAPDMGCFEYISAVPFGITVFIQ